MKLNTHINEIHVYNDPYEFVKLFDSYQNLSDEEKSSVEISDDLKEYAFVTKNPNNLYILIDPDHWDMDDIRETIAHEIGHFQKKIIIFVDEEAKADYFMEFSNFLEKTCKEVYEIILNNINK